MSQSPPPGWYADPQGLPAYRWWDGQTWTGHTADAQPAAFAAPAPQPGFYAGPVTPAPTVARMPGTPAVPSAGAGQAYPGHYRPAQQSGGWVRNQYAFITLGIVALYALIAWKGHVYILGILPVVMSIRSQARREPLAVVAIIAAAVAVLIAVVGLTHH